MKIRFLYLILILLLFHHLYLNIFKFLKLPLYPNPIDNLREIAKPSPHP